jgi:hypothetical protein
MVALVTGYSLCLSPTDGSRTKSCSSKPRPAISGSSGRTSRWVAVESRLRAEKVVDPVELADVERCGEVVVGSSLGGQRSCHCCFGRCHEGQDGRHGSERQGVGAIRLWKEEIDTTCPTCLGQVEFGGRPEHRVVLDERHRYCNRRHRPMCVCGVPPPRSVMKPSSELASAAS